VTLSQDKHIPLRSGLDNEEGPHGSWYGKAAFFFIFFLGIG